MKNNSKPEINRSHMVPQRRKGNGGKRTLKVKLKEAFMKVQGQTE
jgi:hypothetical protein